MLCTVSGVKGEGDALVPDAGHGAVASELADEVGLERRLIADVCAPLAFSPTECDENSPGANTAAGEAAWADGAVAIGMTAHDEDGVETKADLPSSESSNHDCICRKTPRPDLSWDHGFGWFNIVDSEL